MIHSITRAWHKFWFEPVPVTAVCVYRIGLGILAFLNGLLYWPNFDYFFGAQSLLPGQAVAEILRYPRFSIFQFFQPSDTTLYALLAAYILCALCVTIGLRTKLSMSVLWLLAISFRARDPFLWHSVDFILILMLQLLFFTPANARFSIDALLCKRHGKQMSHTFVPWVQRLMQVQETAVYFAAFWGKVYGSTWWQGTAVYYATHTVFIKFGMPPLLDNMLASRALSWGTLAIEFSLFTLIWFKPLRYWILAAGVALHVLINWSLDIDFLEHIMVLGYILFIYPEDVERAVDWIKARLVPRTGQPAGVAGGAP